MTFETTNKFPIAFVRIMLGKVGVDGVTWPRWEIDRYEFDSKITLKVLGCK